MNFFPFYDESESLSNNEIFSYFKLTLFRDLDASKINLDDLIRLFSNKEVIEKCKKDLDLSTDEFFSFIISFLKESCDMKSFTRSKKKIAQLQLLVHDIS